MDFTHIISFTLVASLLVISPGPNGVLIAKTIPTSGRSAGFANIAGFVAAFYLHGSLSILGISLLLVQSSQVFFVVKMLGAIYLCWIGFKALWAAWTNKKTTEPVRTSSSKNSLGAAFLEGFITNVLNPKVSMFYLAAFPQFIPLGGDALSAFFLVSIHCAINFIWFSSMVLLFSRFIKTGKNGFFQRMFKATTGFIFVIFVIFGIKLASLET